MEDIERTILDIDMIQKLRKMGLSNGSSLGHHDGFMDAVADRLEELIEQNKKLKETYKIFTIADLIKLLGGEENCVSVFSDKTKLLIDYLNTANGEYLSEDFLSKEIVRLNLDCGASVDIKDNKNLYSLNS